jgi:hypothetical protein
MPASGAPAPQPNDLVLTQRTGLDDTGQMVPRYRLEVFGKLLPATHYATYVEALSVGRDRAETEGVDLWVDLTSLRHPSPEPRHRLDASFRVQHSPDTPTQ